MTSHIIDITRARATPLCGAATGVCVDDERAQCPDCREARSCAFCGIVGGRQNAEIVDSSNGVGPFDWTAFRPLGPHAPGHVLFVPRRHVRDATVDPMLTGLVTAAAAVYLRDYLGGQGNLLTSVGPDATQTVFHLHVHVIPRGPDDGLHRDWPWCREEAP